MNIFNKTVLILAAGILLQSNVCTAAISLQSAIEKGTYEQVRNLIAANPKVLTQKLDNKQTPFQTAQSLFADQVKIGRSHDAEFDRLKIIKDFLMAAENPRKSLFDALKEKPVNVSLAKQALSLVNESWITKNKVLDKATLNDALKTAQKLDSTTDAGVAAIKADLNEKIKMVK